MRKESAAERQAWTEFVEGKVVEMPKRASKFGNKRVQFNGKWYDSQREANHAATLQKLFEQGKICDYTEQKRITLVPGDGKLRPVVYVCDFYYRDLDGTPHVVDAKGYKHPIYRLKKRLAALLLRIEIEEV